MSLSKLHVFPKCPVAVMGQSVYHPGKCWRQEPLPSPPGLGLFLSSSLRLGTGTKCPPGPLEGPEYEELECAGGVPAELAMGLPSGGRCP